MYNLNEDEELTHYGQSLAEMEKLNDIVDSDSDSEEKGLLSGMNCIQIKHQLSLELRRIFFSNRAHL